MLLNLSLLNCQICLLPYFWVKPDLDKIKSTCLEYFVKQLVVCVNSLNRLVHAQKLIHIDDLTGLYNYRYLEISLENEISRFERFGESFFVWCLSIWIILNLLMTFTVISPEARLLNRSVIY